MTITNGTVRADGYDLTYRIEGEGAPVLVIGSAVFYPRLFASGLRESCKLVFVDHCGFAEPRRSLMPEDYSLDRITDDIVLMRLALGLEEPVTVMGHSGHAFMALEYARRCPEAVERVVLLNTAPTNSKERQEGSMQAFFAGAEPGRLARFESDMALLGGDLAAEPDRRFAHVCIRMGAQSFCDYGYDGAWLWNGVYTNMRAIDRLWGEVFGGMDLLQLLPQVRKPVFLGLGRHDYLVGPSSLWDGVEAANPHVTKRIYERSGHYPMLEEPEAFGQDLLGWLRQ